MGFFDDAADFIDDKVDDAKDAVDDVADDVGEAVGDVTDGASDVGQEISEGDVGGAVDEAADTVEDVASGSRDTGSNDSGSIGASGSSDSSSGGITIDTGSDDGGGGGSSDGGSDYRPDKDPSELDPGESTTIEIDNQNEQINVDPIEMPDRTEEGKKRDQQQRENDRFPTMPGVAVSTTVGESETEYQNRKRKARLRAQEGTLRDQKEFLRDKPEGTILQSGNETYTREEAVDRIDSQIDQVEKRQEEVLNTMETNTEIRETNQDIREAREQYREAQVADFFDSPANNNQQGSDKISSVGGGFKALEGYFEDQLDKSVEKVRETNKQAQKAGRNASPYNPVSILGRGQAGLESLGDEFTDIIDPNEKFDPLQQDADFDTEKRAEELTGFYTGMIGTPTTAPLATGNTILAGLGVSFSGGAAEATNKGYDSPYAGSDFFKEGVVPFAKSTGEQIVEDPSKAAGGFILSGGIGRAATTSTRGGVRAARAADFDDIARKAPGASSGSTFNANDLTSFDRLDPRTGLGRKPLPGEPAPDSYGSIASNKFQNFGDFVRGRNLGERPASPDEVRNRFDDADILMGRNRPDTDDPSDPVTVPLNRREVVGEKLPDFEDSKVLDILGTKRKGQLHLTTKQRVKVKEPDVDADTDGPGTVDYLTPDDRRPVERARKGIDTGKEKVGNLIDGFDRPKPSPDVDSGQGIGIGLGAGLASNIGFDDFMDERNMLDQGLQPVNTVDSIQDPFFEDPQIQDPVRNQQVREPRMTDSIVPPPAPKLRDPETRSPDRGRDRKRRRDDEDSRESGLFFFDDFADQPQQRSSKAEFAPSLTALTFDIGGGSRDSTVSPFNVRALPDPSGGKGRKKQDNGFRDPLDFDR
jgi:hypothetical protein